ncbi:MAG TPA: class I SAM-dependent methyltransferase [Flavipsychrobacter sp.]|nr:class I SAM-dependent methyltransferase [Flavipsychrobacter sp.]
MDNYTQTTKDVVDERFKMNVGGIYYAHQPIYGYRTPYAATSNISRYMVTKSILNALNQFNFSNFIDIGGAEGYTANIVKKLFAVPVKTTDLSENACKMASKIFGIEGIPCDIHNLPFANEAFDAVLCSETIEHVTDYQKAIDELLRITKKVLVITVPHETPEIVAENIRNKVPHGHIHYFQTNTLDYLKEQGYKVEFEKTLSPLLVIPRVVAESFKKNNNKLPYRIYNLLTPLFKTIFGIKTANRLTNLDAKFTNWFSMYGGITFCIIKDPTSKKENSFNPINAEDFTDIKVKEYQTDIFKN